MTNVFHLKVQVNVAIKRIAAKLQYVARIVRKSSKIKLLRMLQTLCEIKGVTSRMLQTPNTRRNEPCQTSKCCKHLQTSLERLESRSVTCNMLEIPRRTSQQQTTETYTNSKEKSTNKCPPFRDFVVAHSLRKQCSLVRESSIKLGKHSLIMTADLVTNLHVCHIKASFFACL